MTLQLQWGLSDKFRLEAASLIYDTFIKKFRNTLGPRTKGIRFIANSFQSEFALVAILDDKLVGVAGATTAKGELIHVRFGPWIRSYHIRAIRGFILGVPFWFDRREPGELVLSSLSVVESARGQGIGTRMIKEFVRYGTSQGYRVLKIKVINSNVRAKALYERFGFTITDYSKIPLPWSHLLGFTGFFEMTYQLV